MLEKAEIKELLELLHDRYNCVAFIEEDPISVPHSFSKKEDIEIAGFLAATIAWGQRSQIVKNARYLMNLMDQAPAEFVCGASEAELNRIDCFYYRTFQTADLRFFIRTLRTIYLTGGLEKIFTEAYQKQQRLSDGLMALYQFFSEIPHEDRSMKHLANIQAGSSAKRLNMFLRWMIRHDKRGVDFGIWKTIPASALYLPLDVHSGRTARELLLLERKQNDWKAVLELTEKLRQFDANDPARYDFALFGAGVDKSILR